MSHAENETISHQTLMQVRAATRTDVNDYSPAFALRLPAHTG